MRTKNTKIFLYETILTLHTSQGENHGSCHVMVRNTQADLPQLHREQEYT